MPRSARMPRIQSPPEPAQLDHLRELLSDCTWTNVCNMTAASELRHRGVWFYGRVGCFLRRPCIAVCAENQFVLLKYGTGIENIYDGFSDRESRYELDATPMKGVTLFKAHLETVGIELNSFVLNASDNEGD